MLQKRRVHVKQDHVGSPRSLAARLFHQDSNVVNAGERWRPVHQVFHRAMGKERVQTGATPGDIYQEHSQTLRDQYSTKIVSGGADTVSAMLLRQRYTVWGSVDSGFVWGHCYTCFA
jgi:hypothetical protein